jgi:hypothetical protein
MGRLIIESKAACKGKEAMIGRDEIFQLEEILMNKIIRQS